MKRNVKGFFEVETRKTLISEKTRFFAHSVVDQNARRRVLCAVGARRCEAAIQLSTYQHN
jgi:hypothetical protein